jgi:hypothetical protein
MSGMRYEEVRRSILAQIEKGRLSEDSNLAMESLERVELDMEIEELGVEPAVQIRTVKDFLWLCKAIDLQRELRRSAKPVSASVGKQNL